MQEKERKEFLNSIEKSLKKPNMNKIAYLIERAVRKHNKKLVEYENIVKIGTSKEVEKLDNIELKSLLINIYKYWYEVTLDNKMKNESENPDIVKRITDFKNNPYYKPKNDMPIFKIWRELQDRGYRFDLTSPIYFQGNYFCQFYINEMLKEIRNRANFVDTRIYLNIKPKNIIKLCEILFEKAIKNDLPLLLKIAYANQRNDNFVIYSDYQNLPSFVELIKNTKKDNPELFEDCKVKNPFLATLFGFIGFGEEPRMWGSYNSIRAELLENCYKVLTSEYKENPESLTKEHILNTIADLSEKYSISKENFCLNQSRELLFDFEKTEN